jgi:sulfur carrier protein
MNVIVNGTPVNHAEGATLSDVVDAVTTAAQGIAVALNGTVVPRSGWTKTVVSDADQVEVLTAVQGG